MAITTPRASLVLQPRGRHVIARFPPHHADWFGRIHELAKRAYAVQHPALVSILDVSILDSHLEIVYAPRQGAVPLEPDVSVRAAALAVADVAEGIEALRATSITSIMCGPLDPRLILRDETGGQLLAAWVWAPAYELDRHTTGLVPMMHFVASPESIGAAATTEKTETFYLGYALYQALTHQEPFVTSTERDYFTAVRDGESDPLRVLRPDAPPDLEALLGETLAPDPTARPTLSALASLLRSIVAG